MVAREKLLAGGSCCHCVKSDAKEDTALFWLLPKESSEIRMEDSEVSEDTC